MADALDEHYKEVSAAIKHCRAIKAMYEKTNGGRGKRDPEGHTHIPMSFWKVLEKMLYDDNIRADLHEDEGHTQ